MSLKRAIKTGIKYFGYLFIVVALISYFISLYKFKSGQEPVQMLFGFSGINIENNNMVPVMGTGDYVVIKKVNNPERIKVDDIITFIQEGKLVTQRVVSIINDENEFVFVTKEENREAVNDSIVYFSSIVGKCTLIFPGMANLLSWIFSIKGLVIVVVLISTLSLLPKKKVSKQGAHNKTIDDEEKTELKSYRYVIVSDSGYIHIIND